MRDALLLTLTLVAGYMDALSFLGLDGVFTANMTGNLVILGLAAGQAAELRALGCAAAFASFAVGAALAARLIGPPPPRGMWPVRVTVALGVEGAVLVGFATGWHVVGSELSLPRLMGLTATAAFAMGIQSATAQRLGVAGVSTTYVTGTLTTLMSEVAARSGAAARWLRWAAVLVALALGAVLGAVMLVNAASLAPVVPALLVAAVTAAAAASYPPAPSTPSPPNAAPARLS